VRKDGARYWANVVITPVRDASGGLVGFVKITRDLTEKRKADDERIRLIQAREAIRLRDEFLSIASHELKTPLTALQLQLGNLLGDRARAGELAPKIDRAKRLGDRLTRLIEALLDVSRIATGNLSLNFDRFDLLEAVRETFERLEEQTASAGCVVQLNAPDSIEGDWDRLRLEQVLSNLIANAIKYAAGKPIEVSVRRAGDWAVIEVRDKGPGIAEDDLPRIFERFERAVSPRHHGGLGLGLYVARQIVEAHGGTIVAGNAPDGGARFTVRLPVSDFPEGREGRAVPPRGPAP
jgi:signal transduction histidine kinase